MKDLADIIAWSTAPHRAVRLVKEADPQAIKEALVKRSFNALGELGEYLQLFPGTTFGIPNAPSPLVSTLVGGLTGAGLGYGAGMLAEGLMPATWDRGRARKTFATLGGVLGASPGLLWAATNLKNGRPFFSGQTGANPLPNDDFPLQAPFSDDYDLDVHQAVKQSFEKVAMGTTGLFGAPPIDADEFQNMVWHDPRVAGPLTLPQQAALSGLITGASNLPGKRNTRLVTALDVGRMAAGMGTGFLSGALLGKTLGLLLGMPQSTQDRLKETGIMAGFLANALPLAYG